MTYLVFDLETVPDRARWSPSDPPSVPPEFPPTWAHRVVAIGWAAMTDAYKLHRCGTIVADPRDPPHDVERAALAEFSRMADVMARASKTFTLVTFNGRGFDMPVVVARSMLHTVAIPWWYAIGDMRKRYSEYGHLDLMDHLTDFGAGRRVSLDAMAKLIGLPGKTDVHGSDVADLIERGHLDRVAKYALEDAAQTAMLFVRFRAIQGRIPMAEVLDLEAALADQLHTAGALSLDEPQQCSWCDRIHPDGPEGCP